MNFEDFIIPPKNIKHEKWQIGSLITEEIPERFGFKRIGSSK